MKRLAVVLAACGYCFGLSPAEEARAKEAAREFIKDHLKAPAAAQFSKESICAASSKADFQEAMGLGPTPECKPAAQLEERKITAVYRGSVDAQNSFGALIRAKFQLDLFLKDGKISVHDAMGTVRLLWESCKQANEAYALVDQRDKVRNCDAEYPSAAKK